MSNDCEHYNISNPKVSDAWDKLSALPNWMLKRLKKKAYKDMQKGKHGATGTFYMCKDLLETRKLLEDHR